MQKNTIQVEVLLEPRAVARMFRVNERTLRRWWQAGLFPAPLRVGRRSLRWRLNEITSWILEKEKTNGTNIEAIARTDGTDVQDGCAAPAAT